MSYAYHSTVEQNFRKKSLAKCSPQVNSLPACQPEVLAIVVAPRMPDAAILELCPASRGEASTQVSNLSCSPAAGAESLDSMTSIFHGRPSNNCSSWPSHGRSGVTSSDLRPCTQIRSQGSTLLSTMHERTSNSAIVG